MGGRSAEREVSLSSGRGVVKALARRRLRAGRTSIPATIPATNCISAKPDAVFNALHGRFGEDGTVQGLLELMRLPYTHSGVLASALAMHKERTKDVYRAAGLPVVKSIVADRRKAVAERHLMEPPYVVKPVNEGSSVGVFIIRKGDNRPPAALGSDQWTLSNEMMVEEFVPGRELTVSVMGEQARWASPRSPPIWNSTITKPNMPPAARAISCPPICPPRSRDEAMELALQGASGAGLPRRHPHRFPL